MPDRFIHKVNSLIPNLLDNVYVFILLSIISYVLGGLDEMLLLMLLLITLDVALNLTMKKDTPLHLFKIKLKIILVIIVGTFVDKIFGTVGDISIRKYLLVAYSYNEVIDILQILKEDKGFFIPEQLSSMLEKHKKRK